MVSYTHDGNVGGCSSLFCLAHAVVFGVDDFGSFFHSIAYATQNRCFVRRGTTIPILHDFVRIRAYNGYFTQLSGIEWQEFLFFNNTTDLAVTSRASLRASAVMKGGVSVLFFPIER